MMKTVNVTARKREKMIAFLETLKQEHQDDTKVLKAIVEIEKALNEKKYGLVWEEHEEEVDRMLQDNIPVFTEVKEKEIKKKPEDGLNFLIEGDNLHSLKLLEKTHKGKIDVIYIDPPYNTGKSDFKYGDDMIKKEDSFYHSKWISFVKKRLEVAQRLLSKEGVIFISIDDNEQAQLKILCDELFGNNNFLAQIIWERAYAPVNLKKHFSESHDYIICYAKDINSAKCNGLPRSNDANDRYSNPDNDIRGVWKSSDLSVGPIVESKVYEITTPSGRKVMPPKGYCWRLNKKTFQEYVDDNRIWFGHDGNNVPSIKRFLSEVKQGITPMTIWKYTDVGHSQDATKELKELFGGEAKFTYPKSVRLIKRIIELYSKKDSIILDFFAGSGTTAQAVLELNQEDGGNRKFILCTNNENNICEDVTYERIKTVITGKRKDGSEYSEGIPANLKYYKTDFIPKDEEYGEESLNKHIKELIQLEKGHCDEGKFKFILSDDDADQLEKDFESYKELEELYISDEVLLTTAQKAIFKNLKKIVIPERYYH